MRGCICIFLLGIALVTVPIDCQQRIVGGSLAEISSYPFVAALLYSTDDITFTQSCGGSILNSRAILTAAQCPTGEAAGRWRMRVGSSFGNSGGVVHNVNRTIIHENYTSLTYDSDIAILLSATVFEFNDNVSVASIAGANYNILDGQPVWAAGWGSTYAGGSPSEQLRDVQIWTVNQDLCQVLYAVLGYTITDNMLCSGWVGVGGRGPCNNDAGGPLLHNNVIVGIVSWSEPCGSAIYPGVNTRVSRFASWIEANA